jgi:hypothetical protein
MKEKRSRSPFKIALIVVLVLGVVYFISQYARRHEVRAGSLPGPAETTLGRDGEAK